MLRLVVETDIDISRRLIIKGGAPEKPAMLIVEDIIQEMFKAVCAVNFFHYKEIGIYSGYHSTQLTFSLVITRTGATVIP